MYTPRADDGSYFCWSQSKGECIQSRTRKTVRTVFVGNFVVLHGRHNVKDLQGIMDVSTAHNVVIDLFTCVLNQIVVTRRSLPGASLHSHDSIVEVYHKEQCIDDEGCVTNNDARNGCYTSKHWFMLKPRSQCWPLIYQMHNFWRGIAAIGESWSSHQMGTPSW